MTSPKSGPLWLCSIPGRPAVFATANGPTEAAAVCRTEAGAAPTSVTYGGYTATPPPSAPRPGPRTVPTAAEPSRRSTKRAELAVTLYALLRCDFPIRSILQPFDAASRLPSNSALRDFLADFGTALDKLRNDSKIIEDVVTAQGNGWIAAAREKNARDAGKWQQAEVEADRKIGSRQHAKRLRKRVAYRKAIAELSEIIEGMLPSTDAAANGFRRQLANAGLGADDIESLVSRFRRIAVPKL